MEKVQVTFQMNLMNKYSNWTKASSNGLLCTSLSIYFAPNQYRTIGEIFKNNISLTPIRNIIRLFTTSCPNIKIIRLKRNKNFLKSSDIVFKKEVVLSSNTWFLFPAEPFQNIFICHKINQKWVSNFMSWASEGHRYE